MWIWFVLAGICLTLELLVGSFYLLFVAIGLVMGGIVAWLELSVYWSIFAFIATSLSCVFVFRLFGISKQGKTRTATSDANVNLDIGSEVYVSEWSNRHAYVNYRGARWQAVLADDVHAETAGTHIIVDIKGVMLVLTPQKA